MKELYHGKKLDMIILAGHIQMMNWDVVMKDHKPNFILDNIIVLLSVGLLLYMIVR